MNDPNEWLFYWRSYFTSVEVGIPLSQLEYDLYKLYGSQNPFKQLGFSSIEALLNASKQFTIQNSIVYLVDSNKPYNLTDLINKQKSKPLMEKKMDVGLKYPSQPEMQISNDAILSFERNCGNLTLLNPYKFDEVFTNQYDTNELHFTMLDKLETDTVWDLNLPQSLEKDLKICETGADGPVTLSPTGILPCQNEFGGKWNFEVILDSSCQQFRQKWVYSNILGKIFIDMDKVLLLSMKYDSGMISNDVTLFVRAMPMFSAVDFLKEPVNRCLQHLSPVDKINKSFIHLEHVIRCDNENTIYHVDEVSKRKSVVTLLSRPGHGSDSTKLSYRFMCKSSCSSGMRRRPIIVIFTLENNKMQVFGRRVLSVRICSCPKRDLENEEKYARLLKPKELFCNKMRSAQEHHHNRSDSDQPPHKIKKNNSLSSTEFKTENIINKMHSLLLNYATNNKEHYKKMLESLYITIVGVSSLYNIEDTEALINDIKTRLTNLK